MKNMLKTLLAALIASAPVLALSGTLTVQSPNNNQYVGSTTEIKVQTTGGFTKVTVTAQIVQQGGGASTTLTTEIFPDGDGKGNGTMTWSANSSFPETLYDITVTATADDTGYNNELRTVTLDRTKPKFLEFSPTDGSFFNGTINITALIQETSGLKEWRVKVDNQDIPNNTGTTLAVDVPYTPSVDDDDGIRVITITAKDLADNEAEISLEATLDRQPPEIFVTYPRSDFRVRPNSTLSVNFNVEDSDTKSVDVAAIRVEIQDMDGNFIRRVSRRLYDGYSPTGSRWMGRVRMTVGNRTRVKIVISCVDKAGNASVVQEVPIQIGRR